MGEGLVAEVVVLADKSPELGQVPRRGRLRSLPPTPNAPDRTGPIQAARSGCTAKKTGCGTAGGKGLDIVNIRSNRFDCGKCYR
jgi:hypothetical protein